MPPHSVRFPVHFDQESFDTDIRRLSARDRAQLTAIREEIERDGIDAGRLRRCAEGAAPDGTDLTGCVKTRIPNPDSGAFGIVFVGAHDGTRTWLDAIAIGQRHPVSSARQSVYQIAHHRLWQAQQ